ncbi:hypothetical protein DMI69_18170 [Escherichia coli]|nr:hypothetical protein [Escherichia coli]
MAGELAQIGLLIGSEDRQNMLIYAIAFDFTYQCLSPRPKAVPRISDTASHFTYRFMGNDAEVSNFL